MGAQRSVASGQETTALVISMPPNPSHLEHINPVVEGMARAADTRVDEPGAPIFYEGAALPILIHGDASFSGQGVVAETLNLSRLPGYGTAGSIHIITNNQLGFTTDWQAERSTLYASDLAKGFEIPIIHVNADDPEACIEAARIAFAYRARFAKDFLIDLIGYRRYGHNEGDEPSFTQPIMYEQIARRPTVRALWADRLITQRLIVPETADRLVRGYTDELQRTLESLAPEEQVLEPQLQPPPPGMARRVKTSVPVDRLRDINEALKRIAGQIKLNPKLERTIRRRRSALDDENAADVDWGTAEELALASILADGVPIRLTGQDTERGTFNQRHAVYHDVETGATITPLQMLPQARAAFEVINSPLSENAALGFEYGYNSQAPDRLTIWEAQYGDFINGGQAMIDEFIVSGRAKWEQTPSMVMLLPHGYEGQGPDHSSARIERFLQSAAEINIRIAAPSTAGQYFHLLRRQAALLHSDPLPLVVMTPKSLLRNRLAASSLRTLGEGKWEPVIDDEGADPNQVRRLILCSGKIYVDLVTNERREQNRQVAVARIEQIYPFPVDPLRDVLSRYPGLTEVMWVQEEPENMGAWSFARMNLRDLIGGRLPIHYIGRPLSSSPAEGSSALHSVNQDAIVEQAYNLAETSAPRDIAWLKRT
jgi:2-oxoglutarate dehydrogenase E1 component